MNTPAAVVKAIANLNNSIQTPYFIYDLDGFEQHIKQLVKSNLVLWYAVKANPLSAVIKILSDNGFGFDVASTGELDQVLAQGVNSDRILHTGPAKSFEQLQYFLQQGVKTYVVESIQQLEYLQKLSQDVDFEIEVLLRVQLSWEESSKQQNNPLGGAQLTPFGLTADDWLSVNIESFSTLNIIGLHIFQWGNIQTAKALKNLWSTMISPLQCLAEKLNLHYQVLDLGGGLGIPYEHNSQPLVWSDIDTVLTQIKQQISSTKIWMELGRYVIGSFGYYICQVVDRKINGSQHQLILSGGINHLMRPAITGEAFPATLLRQSEAPLQKFHSYGPLCTGADQLGIHQFPEDIRVGDSIIFAQCGAYGFSESMPFFLCHTIPAEAIVYQDNIEVLRQPQPASSWLK